MRQVVAMLPCITNEVKTLDTGEKTLEARVLQKAMPAMQKLAPGEIPLGMYTFSHLGRSVKDTDGLSLQIKGCFAHMESKGGIDMLRMISFQECDLRDNDMSLFGNWLARYSVYLKHLDFAQNQIGDLEVTYLFNSAFTVPTGPSARLVVNLDLSNNKFGDPGAGHIAAFLKGGYLPALKSLDVHGNNITPAGYGYFVSALEAIPQNISIVFNEVKGFSKDALKQTMKVMLSIAKANGISTKEMLTTDETIAHCKQGVTNVGYNITSGIVQCVTPIGTIVSIVELDLGAAVRDILSYVSSPFKKIETFVCLTQATVFSVVDENFSNCLKCNEP